MEQPVNEMQSFLECNFDYCGKDMVVEREKKFASAIDEQQEPSKEVCMQELKNLVSVTLQGSRLNLKGLQEAANEFRLCAKSFVSICYLLVSLRVTHFQKKICDVEFEASLKSSVSASNSY
eukprot:jgi/Galph1/5975/GphlegSOOS_G4624.1